MSSDLSRTNVVSKFQSARNSILQLNNPLRHYLFLILIRADKNWFSFSSSLPLLCARRIYPAHQQNKLSICMRWESAAWWLYMYAYLFIKHSSYLERSISRLFFSSHLPCAFYVIKKLLRAPKCHTRTRRELFQFSHFSTDGRFLFQEKKRPAACLWGRNRWLIDMHIFAPLLLNLAAAAAAVVAAQIFAVGDSNAPALFGVCMRLGLGGGKSHYDELERT